ncbi:hypothetical protein FRC01_003668 [Tulasnella sp. 417]|nr:hypothetical protein FRC01_003668 [Tulasnella sp. 417]
MAGGLGAVPSFPVSAPNQSAPATNAPQLKSEYGPTPFDESSTGDVIFKSSDGIKFKLHRVILQIASSVWKDVFDMPQPADDGETRDLPVIELSEPSTTLLHLFRLLYPIAKQQIVEFDLALELAEAYDKYDIDLSSLVPYLADLFSENSLQAKPVEAFGLAWRLRKGDAVSMASRYLHQTALESREIKDRILRYSADVEALLALHGLRHRRELALDKFMAALPISLYRCPSHANLSAFETQKLRINARKALGTARPNCSDVVQFLDLKQVFNYNARQPFLATAFGFSLSVTLLTQTVQPPTPQAPQQPANLAPQQPTHQPAQPPANQSAQQPPLNQRPAATTCVACDGALISLKFDSGCGLVNSAIGIFPQAVHWPPDS